MDCSLQQTTVTQTGPNYLYKAYIDTLLNRSPNDKVLLTSELFEKDTAGYDDHADIRTGSNTGAYRHSLYTVEGRVLELEGHLHLDVFRQNRLIVNEVVLTLKFWPSKNAFRLMSGYDGAHTRCRYWTPVSSCPYRNPTPEY